MDSSHSQCIDSWYKLEGGNVVYLRIKYLLLGITKDSKQMTNSSYNSQVLRALKVTRERVEGTGERLED